MLRVYPLLLLLLLHSSFWKELLWHLIQVHTAWRLLMTAAAAESGLRSNSAFQYDVVDLGRQVAEPLPPPP